MIPKEVIVEVTQNAKIATTVSTFTTGIGLGTMFELIPHDIGKLATVVGIVLSIVLIYTHWRKGRIEYEKTKIELMILKTKEAHIIAQAEKAEDTKNRTEPSNELQNI